MKRLITQALVMALFLASASLASAQVTRKSYFGTYNGAPCTVQMNWYNWAGLGPVDGRIKVANGATIAFTGSNTQNGVLDLNAGGNSIRLVRRTAGRKTSWTSPTLSLTEGAAPTPTPSPSPTPMAGDASGAWLVDQTYTGTWKGKPFTAQMRWAPGDTPEVLRRGFGTVTLEDGTQLSIEGSQLNAESMEFSLAPDSTGETYKTTKAAAEGIVGWESSSLTLIEKK
jgi:hypothetical protein